MRGFIPNLAELTKPLNALLKKAISTSPVLACLDYNKEFMIYSYASDYTIAAMLLQKNNENHEQPIAFMSKNLRDAKLKYTTTEKQVYALVKALKHFGTSIGFSKIKAYVPYQAVKDVLSQSDGIGIRGKWISRIQEYDLEIKPIKIVKGQGLAQLLKEKEVSVKCVEEDHDNPNIE